MEVFQVPAATLGIAGCEAPFDGSIAFGIRDGGGSSLWLILRFGRHGLLEPTVECYTSEDHSFPDEEFLRDEAPVLIAAASPENWATLQEATDERFQHAVLHGDFELGGNFGRYRQHLAWLLESKHLLALPADAKGFADRYRP